MLRNEQKGFMYHFNHGLFASAISNVLIYHIFISSKLWIWFIYLKLICIQSKFTTLARENIIYKSLIHCYASIKCQKHRKERRGINKDRKAKKLKVRTNSSSSSKYFKLGVEILDPMHNMDCFCCVANNNIVRNYYFFVNHIK